MRCSSAAAALLALLLVEQGDAAKRRPAKSAGCTVTSVWPDGTTLDRECLVQGDNSRQQSSSGSGTISDEFRWLRNTRWNWNDWRDVVFGVNGDFLAPAEGCEQEGNRRCTWYTEDETIFVSFGGAGLHKLQADDERTLLFGFRERDGDEVRATRR